MADTYWWLRPCESCLDGRHYDCTGAVDWCPCACWSFVPDWRFDG